ncbi:MAG: hypothetical protein AVO38_03690 [delta proteobacterium ML8_D]|jgi:hypothetical protein|nr:MAG: hypothetical protein AVO38_03690 [delta proteobacterium ML8_D]
MVDSIIDLSRGPEAYRSDERVVGSSVFVEALFEKANAQSRRDRQLELPKLKKRIAKDTESAVMPCQEKVSLRICHVSKLLPVIFGLIIKDRVAGCLRKILM